MTNADQPALTQEMKDEIDSIASDIAVLKTGKERMLKIYAVLTKYAEKVEENEITIKSLKERYDHSAKRWDAENNNLIKELGRRDARLESKEAELSLLKVIAEKMKEAMEYVNENTPGGKWKTLAQALTAYAEYCKEK